MSLKVERQCQALTPGAGTHIDRDNHTCTTDLKANQSGMSSPARRALRNLVPDKFSLCRPSLSATSAVT